MSLPGAEDVPCAPISETQDSNVVTVLAKKAPSHEKLLWMLGGAMCPSNSHILVGNSF
jgi:hypothetical protein